MNFKTIELDTIGTEESLFTSPEMNTFKIFRGKAFVSKEKISGRYVIGNPASIVLFPDVFPDHDELSKIATEEQAPMTAFIRKKETGRYDIIYYTPAGESFGLCGHATLIAAYFLHKEYGQNNVVFTRDFDGLHHDIKSHVMEGLVKIVMPAFVPVSVQGVEYGEIVQATGMNENAAYSFYRCNELHDMIIVTDDTKALRAASPRFSELAGLLAKQNIRGLFVTSRSAETEADYEVRIFAPHLGIQEDISCGSANCSLLPLWDKQLNAENNRYSILCPYNDNGIKYGGIELGSYNANTNEVRIGGSVTEI
ncbi:MAG: PhzF family phenazine biosynthesis protein [Sphingobacteriales bacterium]|nr:MAG: PhzF family phenazine biosynthesis protein [Sphingobacteriales bacterium]